MCLKPLCTLALGAQTAHFIPGILIELQVILVSQTRNLRFQSAFSLLTEEPRDTFFSLDSASRLAGN
jgi:hypothetical protein